MKFQELAVLLPCHSLEDFPQHHVGDDAEGLLACWTALWHPALLAAANSAPAWYRADDPPSETQGRLILVPGVSNGQLPTGFAPRAKDQGACLIRGQHERAAILEQALAAAGEVPDVSAEIAADFLALGYCFLQIQLLTRQMRYASNLDEVHFFDQLLAAARAAVEGQDEEARQKLTACFDLLAEERDHYYSVDAYLLDLTLVAPNTLGAPLRDELQAEVAVNLLLDGEVLAAMTEREPDTWERVRQAVSENRAGVLGGEQCERRLPLLACESILGELRRAAAGYQALLGQPLDVYARRRFGLNPMLPQILEKLGFRGALHATLDDGRFPQGSQVKTRWEGVDGTAIDSLAKTPLDASKPETFLGLAHKLGESMDMDHVATLCLAHWPGRACVWYGDLRRAARYAAALGKFVTVQAYFRETYMPGHAQRFEAEQYLSPYLRQSVVRQEADPISTVVRFWRRRAAADHAHTLRALAALTTGEPQPENLDLAREVDQHSEEADAPALDGSLEAELSSAAERLAQVLPRQPGGGEFGYLVLNPCSFARRVCVETPQLPRLPSVGKPVYATAEAAAGQQVVVDLPPLGFVWLAAGETRTPHRRKAPPPLAEDLAARDGVVVLRNEFFEAVIDPTTGALQSLKDYYSRGNRLSQQLALRLPAPRPSPGEDWRDPDASAAYSVMAADRVEVTAANPAVGEVAVQGRLVDRQGAPLADFRQTFRAVRGSRVLELAVEVEPSGELRADPWNSYYACRFAWADEAAELQRSVQQTRQAAGGKRIEAPLLVEIHSGELRTAILTGGLPYHRRVGLRMLDTLLIVHGERQRSFRLGIGIDLPSPIQEAMGMLSPPVLLPQTAAAPAPASFGWLFHIDSRNVLATHWEPIIEEGAVVGFAARLLETAGRAVRARLSCFRPVASARRLDFRGQSLSDCQLDKGRIVLDLTPYEWAEITARWE